jgi:hypothetical protein
MACCQHLLDTPGEGGKLIEPPSFDFKGAGDQSFCPGNNAELEPQDLALLLVQFVRRVAGTDRWRARIAGAKR